MRLTIRQGYDISAALTMITTHTIFFENSRDMGAIASASAHLVVTSPPYPMIEMWDDMFGGQNKDILRALLKAEGLHAFELMHQELDPVWKEVYRILKSGGLACINVGDAARTIAGNFSLYPNHIRILTCLLKLGFSPLPLILWRKTTNAPNKFMGSGMLPAGAYVTLEHEYILIVRKGPKRVFEPAEDKQIRRESAFFWEERNQWFSDVWTDLVGTRQMMTDRTARLRSAAFPFELAFRLINMFSAKGDTVVDPFAGTGTTMRAAMAAGRNSIGYEIETTFRDVLFPQAAGQTQAVVSISNNRIHERLRRHLDFVQHRLETKGEIKHNNKYYHFPVMTRQEVELFFNPLEHIRLTAANTIEVTYADASRETFSADMKQPLGLQPQGPTERQLKLF
jgi:modification methylase